MSSDLIAILWRISIQSAVVAAVVWIVCRLARKAPASWRSALWLLVIVKFFIPPFAYLPAQLAFWQHPEPIIARAEPAPEGGLSSATPATTAYTPAPNAPPAPATQSRSQAWPSAPIDLHQVLALCWLAGVMAMAGLIALRITRQRKLTAGSTAADDDVTALVSECAAKLDIRRLPRIRFSDLAPTPVLIGALRQTILLPGNILDSCRPHDLRVMLLHELAHVKRRDLLVLWLQQVAQALFFFNPAIWLAGREIKRERELACDELVLSRAGIAPKDYAAGYVSALKLANNRPSVATSLAMAEPFDLEKRRLRGILERPVPKLPAPWLILLFALVAVSLPTFIGWSEPISKVNGSTTKQDLRLLAGFTPVQGAGVVVTLRDSQKLTPGTATSQCIVHDRDVRDVINELWAAGAKAISINGQRIVGATSVRCVGPTVRINFAIVNPPYVIKAVGDPTTLAARLQARQGVGEGLSLLGMITVKRQSSVKVPAYQPGPNRGSSDPDLLAGTAAIGGPGIVVTLHDSSKLPANAPAEAKPDYIVHEADLRALINELLASQAIAISVNDHRWVTGSFITFRNGAIYLNSTRLTPPYTIKAVGDPETLTKTLVLPGSPAEGLTVLAMIEVAKQEDLQLPAGQIAAFARIKAPAADSPDISADRSSQLPDAARNDPNRAMELIRNGADVNVTDAYGRTALHFAVFGDNYELAKLLIDHGAKVNVKEHSVEACYGGWGWYPLHLALRNENKDMIQMLIAHGADVNAPRTDRWFPLHTAACHGQPDMIELLITHGAKVDVLNKEHSTPLRIAINYRKIEGAKVLIQNGANVNSTTTDGWTPLHAAASLKSLDAVRLLLAHRAIVDARSKDLETPLGVAARHGHSETAKLLIASRATVNVSNAAGKTPLYEAAYRGYADTVKLLISKGANVNARSKNAISVLKAAENGEIDYVSGKRQDFDEADQVPHDWAGVRRLLTTHGAKL